MTTLRFAGVLPWWLALLLALTFSTLCWRYYRRERHDLTGKLRWLLPLLRSVAFFMVAFALAGPILHHRQVIGELGRVLIYVDGSESMTVQDSHMSVARKLLVARQLGWIPEDHIDTAPFQLAEEMRAVRQDAVERLQDPQLNPASWKSCRDDFVESVEAILKQWRGMDGDWDRLPLAIGDPPGDPQATIDVREQLSSAIVEVAQSLTVPSFEAESAAEQPVEAETGPETHAAIQSLLPLCQGLQPFEDLLLESFQEQIDQHLVRGDELTRSAIARFDETPRWRRGEAAVLDPDHGLIAQLKKTHDIHLMVLVEGEATPIWSGDERQRLEAFPVTPSGKRTNLASGVASATNRRGRGIGGRAASAEPIVGRGAVAASDGAGEGRRTAVVILSDGQHNAGPSPQQVAQLLGQQGIGLHTVGTGSRREPPDLAVLEAEYPDTIFQKDLVRGSLAVRDKMDPGRAFAVEIRHADRVLWREEFKTQNVMQRSIDFEFSVDELVQRMQNQTDQQSRRHAVPLELEAVIVPLEGETDVDNNQVTMRLAAITQTYRILIIDGRSRWETRYLRNAFQRDTQWEIDTIMVGPGTDHQVLPRGDESGTFPLDRDRLFEYDMIVFGEVPAEVWQPHELLWIREYVERKGGGLILIDGQRKSLSNYTNDDFVSLIPVDWTDESLETLPTKWQLTDRAAGDAAFRLAVDDAENQLLWSELPPPHQLHLVESLPDATPLLKVVVENTEWPAMVLRSFGAGRVLYSGTDETWRWRYKVADTYHQRFWHQVARAIMAKPFAASDEFASLDTGSISYPHGAQADIRVRLLGLDGKPATETTVDALVWKDGQVVQTVSLTPDATVPGIFRGTTPQLQEGQYEVTVQASGYSREVLKAKTQFVVEAAQSEEFLQVACNEELLQEMAAQTQGRYFREEQLASLVELLKPLSSGEVVESDTELWQSYWWFGSIVFILAVEWMLRKRAGMM